VQFRRAARFVSGTRAREFAYAALAFTPNSSQNSRFCRLKRAKPLKNQPKTGNRSYKRTFLEFFSGSRLKLPILCYTASSEPK
jgi:hypothetical protein